MRRWFLRAAAFSLALLCWTMTGRAQAGLAALPCESLDVLSEVAALLLLDDRAPTSESLKRAAGEAGYKGPSLHVSGLSDDAALARWLRGLHREEDAQLACGEARTERRRFVVAAPRTGELLIVDGRLVGTLGPGFAEPELVLQGRDGRPRRMPVSVKALERGVALSSLPERVVRVQLVAQGSSGPRPVATLDLAGAQADGDVLSQAASMRPTRAAVAAGAPAPGPLLARIDAARQALGAPELRNNALLRKSAERQARRVCQRGQVAHRLDGEDDDPVSRLRRARIEARAVGEAVGRASSPDAALEAIFASPSHRLAVTERRFTDMGLGHARDPKGRSCLIVLLAAWPRRLP